MLKDVGNIKPIRLRQKNSSVEVFYILRIFDSKKKPCRETRKVFEEIPRRGKVVKKIKIFVGIIEQLLNSAFIYHKPSLAFGLDG